MTVHDMALAIPSAAARPEQTFFNDPVLDRLMGVTLALAAEVHMLRERVRDLEEARGPSLPDAAARRDDAAAFAAHVLEPLLGRQSARGPL